MIARHTTQPRGEERLMTWTQPPRRDHAMAALGMLLGMLVVALFVTAIVILDATTAHAAVLDDRHGYREAAGAMVQLAIMFGGSLLALKIYDAIKRRKGNR